MSIDFAMACHVRLEWKRCSWPLVSISTKDLVGKFLVLVVCVVGSWPGNLEVELSHEMLIG